MKRYVDTLQLPDSTTPMTRNVTLSDVIRHFVDKFYTGISAIPINNRRISSRSSFNTIGACAALLVCMKTTHHANCKMAFGRPSKHNECPRCEELKAGSEPRKGWGAAKKEEERRLIQAIRSHDCKARNCGSVCTAFDW